MPSDVLTTDLQQWLLARARLAGFDLAGIAAVPMEGSNEAAAGEKRFANWVDAGFAGDMNWLKREDASGRRLRENLLHAMPWARSVLVCAIDYGSGAPLSVDPAKATAGWIARYAWSGQPAGESTAAAAPGEARRGSDYHDVLLPRLRDVEQALRERVGGNVEARCYVDTGPILERDYAARAGIGWIGRNTCVLNQREGSWLLLGVVVTSLEVAANAIAMPAADRCGSCTRCVDACPTGALLGDGENGIRSMDAARCIAYLTIEKRGEIDPALRPLMGRQVFGCDICQDVCPWNRKAPVAKSAALSPRAELVNPELSWLAGMDGTTFNRWFRGSPLERTGRKRMLRNVALAMGNSGERRYLTQLQAWAAGDDAVLAEAARWAEEQLHSTAPPEAP